MDATLLKVGCCGWQSSQARYVHHFDLLEIDSSFYKLPMLKTAQRWRAQAPPGFIFTMKAWQLITHEPYQPTYRRSGQNIPSNLWRYYGSFRPTVQVFTAWRDTLVIAQALGAPVVVFQCPAQFIPTAEHIANLRAFFQQAERADLLFAWEPRGSAWTPGLVRSLCQELDLIHCVDPFLNPPVHGWPRYFRLHGSADYTYQFTDGDLTRLAEWVQGQDVYCLFNNMHMWADAFRFKRMLGIPPLPADALDAVL